ncbi:hypothetical protein [Achromobacter spanius]
MSRHQRSIVFHADSHPVIKDQLATVQGFDVLPAPKELGATDALIVREAATGQQITVVFPETNQMEAWSVNALPQDVDQVGPLSYDDDAVVRLARAAKKAGMVVDVTAAASDWS